MEFKLIDTNTTEVDQEEFPRRSLARSTLLNMGASGPFYGFSGQGPMLTPSCD